MEEMIKKNIVREKLIEWIGKYAPNYQITDLTNLILDYAFDKGPEYYTIEEANELILSLTFKMRDKNINGTLTPFEKDIYFCKDKLFKHKGSASVGNGEYFVALIMNWDFAKSKGCDLVDQDGTTYDIKATRKELSSAGIPCTFYINETPIKKFRGNVIFNHNVIYKHNSKFYKDMYTAIYSITECKIEYNKLDKYLYLFYDEENNNLIHVIKDKNEVENDINKQLKNIDSSKIILTKSLWEDGAYAYTFSEFAVI